MELLQAEPQKKAFDTERETKATVDQTEKADGENVILQLLIIFL